MTVVPRTPAAAAVLPRPTSNRPIRRKDRPNKDRDPSTPRSNVSHQVKPASNRSSIVYLSLNQLRIVHAFKHYPVASR